MLVIMYGRGERSIAEQLGCDVEEARQIKNDVYEAFPRIKTFERDSQINVKTKGYVCTLWGRKRHLPDYNLPNYSFKYIDPADETKVLDTPVPEDIKSEYTAKLQKTFWKGKDKIIEDAKVKDGILIIDNNSKIAAAGRQIINAQVQGSSADMSKLALIKIRNDEELIKRQVKIIIPVHDEILIETPLRYAKYVKTRFANDMETAAKPRLTIPVKCDVVSSERWYGDEIDLNKVLGDLPDI